MSGYVLHPAAYDDLEDIWEYLAADNIDAADRVRDEIHEPSALCCLFPIKATGVPI